VQGCTETFIYGIVGKWVTGVRMSLPRDFVKVDVKGRITLPKRFREALGLKDGEKSVLIVEARPSLENAKALVIRKVA